MLRTRLNSGFLCLLIIVLAMGLYSIDRCANLGSRIQNILQENYETVAAVQQMKSCTMRLTALLLKSRLPDRAKTQEDFSTASREFEEALEKEEKFALNAEEKKPAENLRKLYGEFQKQAWLILQGTSGNDKLAAAMEKIAQQTAQMNELSDTILNAHEKQMRSHNENSGQQTTNAIRLLIFTMLLACVITLYLSFRATRWILNPLTNLTDSIRQIGEGNLDQRIPAQSSDELGVLASSFNKMASQLKDLQDQSSERLLRLDQTMRKTLTSFPDPIFVLNDQGVIDFRNPSADSLAVKLLFAGIARLPDPVQKLFQDVMRSGQDYVPSSYKEAIKFQFNNTDAYYMPRVVLLKDDHEVAFGAAIILEDITRMHLLDVMKSNLVSTVSHELKTPLTGLRMAIYLLQEQSLGTLNENQADLVATARETTDRMLKMLNDFLNLTRLEEGVPNLQLQALRPQELISTAINEIKPLAELSQMEIIAEAKPDLPPVLADPQRIGYVFNNLLGNAIKYSPANRSVLVRAQLTDENQVKFVVRDHGPGIPPEHHSRLFEKFYRVPGSEKSGTGLGLAIAREIVVAHGGEIGVRSWPGEGSEFYVILPCAATAGSGSATRESVSDDTRNALRASGDSLA